MMVARQVTAWDVSKKVPRPGRDGMIAMLGVCTAPNVSISLSDRIIPSRCDGALFLHIPGASYLATIIQSLRDKSAT